MRYAVLAAALVTGCGGKADRDNPPATEDTGNVPVTPWGMPAPLGNLLVAAETVVVDAAHVVAPGGFVRVPGVYLTVGVRVSCPDPAAAPAFGPGKPEDGGYTADVRDGFGNTYKLIRFRSPAIDFGRQRGGEGMPQLTAVTPVRNESPVNDFLVFDPPAPAATDLVLTIRANGTAAALSIPAARWKR